MRVNWVDAPITSKTHIRAIHVTQLRDVVNTDRANAHLPVVSWVDGTVSTGTRIRAVHLAQLRSAIQDLWNYAGRGGLPGWSAGSNPSSARTIRARDVNDLRLWRDAVDPDLYYGCDSSSNSFPCARDFYIGKLGQGADISYDYFNAAAAASVGPENTYGYWYLEGPGQVGAGDADAAYAWGVQQAGLAAQARLGAPSTIYRVTIFADVEVPGTYGWGSYYALNQKVWEGFFNQIANNVLSCGLYSTASQWEGIMGIGYGVPPGTAIWSADLTNTVPCQSCPQIFPALPNVGGVPPVIWQYNGTPGCANDLNAALGLP